MEIKEAILSTLAELEGEQKIVEPKRVVEEIKQEIKSHDTSSDDLKFFQNLRERVLVLFEGFQSPNNKNIEAKIDLTLNFLEYLLATIDERIEKLER